MEIVTKFSPEQIVFFMHENKVQKNPVKSISISTFTKSALQAAANAPVESENDPSMITNIDYTVFSESGVKKCFPENKLFASKEELLNSL